MDYSRAVKGGVTGASSLVLVQEALHALDPKAPRPLLHLKIPGKKDKKKSGRSIVLQRFIPAAGSVLTTAAYFSCAALGNRDNALVRGSLLGIMAGLWNTINSKKQKGKAAKKKTKNKLLTLALYTIGGIAAGAAVKNFARERDKNPSRSIQGHNRAAKLLSTILMIDGTPVGYEVKKEKELLYFLPTRFTDKECCPPEFKVRVAQGTWRVEGDLDPAVQNQVVQEIELLKAGNLLN